MRLNDAVYHKQRDEKHYRKEAKEESDIFLEIEPETEKEIKTKPAKRKRKTKHVSSESFLVLKTAK